MEVSYKKDFDKSYMLIRSEVNQNDYKMKMVTGNLIPGLNSVLLNEFNNEITIYYDISGKSPMANVFAGKKIKAENIRSYIMGIQQLLESSNQYMLDVDKVLMDFEYVYIKNDNDIPTFCYYPDKKESFLESLQRVFDKIIEIADHSDRETVIVSYGLQQLRLGEGNVTINDIIKFVNGSKSVEEKNEGFKEVSDDVNDNNARNYYNTIGRKDDNYSNIVGKECKHVENSHMKRSTSYEEECTKSSVWQEKIKELLQPILKAKDNLMSFKGKYQTEEELDSVLAEEEKEYGSNIKNCEESYQKYESFSGFGLESEYEEDSAYGYNDCDATVLLKPDSMQKGVVLKCSDIERAETIIPNDYPCILGKSRKSADYVIEDKSVSRVHLRLYEEENGYYIEDLNSTNGTYLNEEKLIPHQITKINIGDRVKLSEIEYVVC